MKKPSVCWVFACFLALTMVFAPGCSRKSGCQQADQISARKIKKNGMPKGKAQSQLFDKRTRRRMRN